MLWRAGYALGMERIQLDARDYYPVLDERQAPSLVIVTSPSCGACRRLKRLLDQLPPPLPALVLFEVDAASASGIVEDLEIFHLPAMFLYQAGDYHAPVHAVLRAEALTAAVSAAAAGPRQEPP